jgi:hypothetical protein
MRHRERMTTASTPQTVATVAPVGVRRARPTWVVAGLLFLAAGLLMAWVRLIGPGGLIVRPERDFLVVDVIASAVLLVGCLVAAWGTSPADSIVARRTGGVVALVGLGAVLLGHAIWWMGPGGYGAGPGAGMTGVMVLGLAGTLAVSAAVSIALARVLPGKWRWMTVVSLGIVVALSLVSTLLFAVSADVGLAVAPLLALALPAAVIVNAVALIALGLTRSDPRSG